MWKRGLLLISCLFVPMSNILYNIKLIATCLLPVAMAALGRVTNTTLCDPGIKDTHSLFAKRYYTSQTTHYLTEGT